MIRSVQTGGYFTKDPVLALSIIQRQNCYVILIGILRNGGTKMSSSLKQFFQERTDKTIIRIKDDKYPQKWEVRRMNTKIDRRC
jgi:uncharacterized protein YijF (DUF1287 family)